MHTTGRAPQPFRLEMDVALLPPHKGWVSKMAPWTKALGPPDPGL